MSSNLKRDALIAIPLFLLMAFLHELGHFLIYVAIHGVPAWFTFDFTALAIEMHYLYILPWAKIWVAAGGLLCCVAIVFVRNIFSFSIWLGMTIYSLLEVVLHA